MNSSGPSYENRVAGLARRFTNFAGWLGASSKLTGKAIIKKKNEYASRGPCSKSVVNGFHYHSNFRATFTLSFATAWLDQITQTDKKTTKEDENGGFGIHAIRRKSQPLTSLLERVFWTSSPLSKDRGRQARSLWAKKLSLDKCEKRPFKVSPSGRYFHDTICLFRSRAYPLSFLLPQLSFDWKRLSPSDPASKEVVPSHSQILSLPSDLAPKESDCLLACRHSSLYLIQAEILNRIPYKHLGNHTSP